MATVEKAHIEMFDDICQIFFDKESPEQRDKISSRFYRPIFTYGWEHKEDFGGYVLVDQGKIAGFIGAFFSQREIGGKEHNICNLTTWKVREENRTEGLTLLFPFLRMKQHTITGLTVANFVYPVYRKLGFQDLETVVNICPCLPTTVKDGLRGEVSSGHRLEESLLGPDQLRIYRDHLPYKCLHILVREAEQSCYLLCTFTRIRGVPAAYVQYLSNPELFARQIGTIRRELLFQHKLSLLCIENRFLGGRAVGPSFACRLKVPRIMKSSHLQREEIDNLYSELIVFDLFDKKFY